MKVCGVVPDPISYGQKLVLQRLPWLTLTLALAKVL